MPNTAENMLSRSLRAYSDSASLDHDNYSTGFPIEPEDLLHAPCRHAKMLRYLSVGLLQQLHFNHFLYFLVAQLPHHGSSGSRIKLGLCTSTSIFYKIFSYIYAHKLSLSLWE